MSNNKKKCGTKKANKILDAVRQDNFYDENEHEQNPMDAELCDQHQDDEQQDNEQLDNEHLDSDHLDNEQLDKDQLDKDQDQFIDVTPSADVKPAKPTRADNQQVKKENKGKPKPPERSKIQPLKR